LQEFTKGSVIKMKPIKELIKLSHDLSVLYVEDDARIREEMFEILEDFFGVVILAENGEDGLDKFEQYKKKTGVYPDIIITDINMPKCNGIDMSKKVLECNAEQLIVVLSAHNESHYLLDLINMGIEHYLVKPMRPERMLQILQRAAKKVNYRKMEVQYTEKLEKLAYQDPMTGIANRRRFFEKANSLFSQNTFNHFPMSLCIVDIDKFKMINDTFGHDMGDAVIRVFVDAVKKVLSTNNCFARLGGDEFIMMLAMNKEKALTVMQQVQDNINASHTILDTLVQFTVSIGMTEVEDLDQDIDTVIKRADIDLYKEKQMKKKYSSDHVLFAS
jgi:diguanylate cyclase (GGDEF)-like protein